MPPRACMLPAGELSRVLLSKPRVHSVAIELTAFCNQHCDYCYNAWREDRGASIGTPALATLLARIDRLAGAVDLEHVTLTGGEPLASHDLFPSLITCGRGTCARR